MSSNALASHLLHECFDITSPAHGLADCGGLSPTCACATCTEIFSAAVAKWKAMDQDEKKEYTDKFKVGSLSQRGPAC